MSRIGKKPIQIPSGVTVTVKGSNVEVQGTKGKLSIEVRPEIKVEVVDNTVVSSIAKKTDNSNAYWGLTQSLIGNMVHGVSEGYEKKLQLVGVGYRAKETNDGITLTVGYTHPVDVKAPEGIEFEVEDNQNITVKGIDKELVGLTAAKIRAIRKPEPYKGKGIKYADEVVRRKAGKSGKV